MRITCPTGRTWARAAVLPVVGLLLAAAVSGCGGKTDKADETTSPSPTASASLGLTEGVKLTKAGSTLAFGDAATVGFQPNDQKATGLTLTVASVRKGSITDLAAYQLDAQTKAATPYYAQVSVKNVGGTDVGRSSIPLWGLSSDDTLIAASGFTNTFQRCPSGPLPSPFASGASVSTCLMFLVPRGETLDAISFRPVSTSDPILWKGRITSGGATSKATSKATATPTS